jgi:hypothetical protein
MPKIEFVKNFHAQLYESFDPRVRNLLVLDDQMENQSAHKRSADSIVKFFTQGSHHRNLTVVYIVQNLFNQDRSMRTVSLNAHYIVVFKSPRDGTQIQTLAWQMYPGNTAALLDAFKDATSPTVGDAAARGYLLLDLHPTSCDALRMLTNVFEEHPDAYVPCEYIKGAATQQERENVVSSTYGSNASTTTLPSNRRRTQHSASAAPRRYKCSPLEQPTRKGHRSEGNTQVPEHLQEPKSIPERTPGVI